MSIRIDQGLTNRFISGTYGLPIAHENLSYSPVVGTAYAEIFNIPNDETAFSVTDSDETDGVFRVILWYPENDGAVPAKTMADTIFNDFKIGQRITYNEQKIEITGRQRTLGVREAGWYKLVLSISYRTFTTRS